MIVVVACTIAIANTKLLSFQTSTAGDYYIIHDVGLHSGISHMYTCANMNNNSDSFTPKCNVQLTSY